MRPPPSFRVMARLPRLEIPGQPHLLIQRGHNGQAVFRDDQDRGSFRDDLHQAARDAQVSLHAYSLGVREISILATPAAKGGLGRLMQRVGRRYVMGFNARHGRSGTLWEGRFRATVIEPERYLLTAMRLVESHPVREQLVSRASEWPWSSAAHHLGRRSDPLVTVHPIYWSLGNTPFERQARYAGLLEAADDLDRQQELLDAAMRGWVIGDPAFVALVAEQSSRPVQPRPRGRPRKATLDGPN